MDKELLKDVIYGGLNEIIQNRNYYFYLHDDYSKFTQEGEAAVLEYIKMIAHKVAQVERARLKERAKNLVLNNLKGDN